MRKNLRLLVTEICNRRCEGCCNQFWDLESLPVFSLDCLNSFDQLIITGGEPMLIPDICESLAVLSRSINPDICIYLYTAKTKPIENLINILPMLDGICITIHDISDLIPFLDFNEWIVRNGIYTEKSLRLNIFSEEVKRLQINYPSMWIIKDKKWIPHQHLNEHEVFMRLKK
jgi:MoaA/NifB/PqqE/SkfB family radical SAM enzyme